MKIVAIIGSNSVNSKNKKVMEFIKENFKEKMDIDIVTLNDIPMYNEDIETNLPQSVSNLKEKIKNSDGVMVITPEYNYSIPGVLKNALDWLSRGERVLIDKPTMVLGASMGALGTVKAQIHLREILESIGVGALVLPRNDVFIGSVHTKLDENGKLTDQSTVEFLGTCLDEFIDWINLVKK